MTEPGRPTIVMRAVDNVVQNIFRIIMGLIAMSGGFWAVAYEVKHPPTPPATRGSFDIIILGAGLFFALFGFLLMPIIFTQFQSFVIFIFPAGVDVPVVGHLFRRKDDVKPTDPPADSKR